LEMLTAWAVVTELAERVEANPGHAPNLQVRRLLGCALPLAPGPGRFPPSPFPISTPRLPTQPHLAPTPYTHTAAGSHSPPPTPPARPSPHPLSLPVFVFSAATPCTRPEPDSEPCFTGTSELYVHEHLLFAIARDQLYHYSAHHALGMPERFPRPVWCEPCGRCFGRGRAQLPHGRSARRHRHLSLRDRSRPTSILACVGCINRLGLTHSVCDLTFVSGLWCSPLCSFIHQILYTFPFFSLVARGVVPGIVVSASASSHLVEKKSN